MIYNTIQYVVDNGIGTLTFNRPTVANGFNIEMCKEILEVLDKAHNDESVRALLINAEGKVFSAGGDLTEMERAVNEGDTESLFEIVELVAEISMAMKEVTKTCYHEPSRGCGRCCLQYGFGGGLCCSC